MHLTPATVGCTAKPQTGAKTLQPKVSLASGIYLVVLRSVPTIVLVLVNELRWPTKSSTESRCCCPSGGRGGSRYWCSLLLRIVCSALRIHYDDIIAGSRRVSQSEKSDKPRETQCHADRTDKKHRPGSTSAHTSGCHQMRGECWTR